MCKVRSGRTPRRSIANSNAAGAGFGAPASAEVTTVSPRSAASSRCACRPTSQFERPPAPGSPLEGAQRPLRSGQRLEADRTDECVHERFWCELGLEGIEEHLCALESQPGKGLRVAPLVGVVAVILDLGREGSRNLSPAARDSAFAEAVVELRNRVGELHEGAVGVERHRVELSETHPGAGSSDSTSDLPAGLATAVPGGRTEAAALDGPELLHLGVGQTGDVRPLPAVARQTSGSSWVSRRSGTAQVRARARHVLAVCLRSGRRAGSGSEPSRSRPCRRRPIQAACLQASRRRHAAFSESWP
jgi:hypothetical protein